MIRVSRDDGDRNAGDWWDLVGRLAYRGGVHLHSRGTGCRAFHGEGRGRQRPGVSVEHVSGPYDNGLPVRMEVLTSDAIIAIDWES